MYNLKKTIPLILFCLSVITYSCYYDNEDDLYGLGDCDTTNVTFNNVIKPIINNNCGTIGCHGDGNERELLNTYEEIKSVVDDGQLNDRVIVKRDMPPSKPLSKCDIELIKIWIKAGAKND